MNPYKPLAFVALVCAQLSLSGCLLLHGNRASTQQQGQYSQTGRSSIARVASNRLTATRRPALAVAGRIIQFQGRTVTVRMWIATQRRILTHPKVYYRFLIDQTGKRTEQSTFRLMSFQDLTRYYPCSWSIKVKVGEVRDRRNRVVSRLYARRRRFGSCPDPYFRQVFELTFQVPPHLDLHNQIAIRMEAYGSNFELRWSPDASHHTSTRPPGADENGDPSVSRTRRERNGL